MTTMTPEAARSALRALPTPQVWLAGNPLDAETLRTLGPLRIRREASAPALAELELDRTTGLPACGPGTAVRVAILDATPIFDGEVVAVSHRLSADGQHRVRLRCFDRSHRLRQTSGITAHLAVTAAGLATDLAGRHGLDAQADESGPEWPRVIQRGESDLALLSRVAADAALWWQLDGSTLRLRPWTGGEEHTVTWGLDLLEAVVDADATARPQAVRTLAWDPVLREAFDAAAARSEAGVPGGTDDPFDGGDAVLGARVLPTGAHAEAVARSELDHHRAAALTVRAVVTGAPYWRPGCRLRIADQPGEVAGPYLLSAVEHVLDAVSGYVCVLSSAPPPRPEAPEAGAAGFTLAEVVEVGDPDGAGRVRVSFPALDAAESEWLPVLSLGAGESKGLLCQPDAGDTVVVLHALADPGRGVVLGGLYARHLPEDAAGVAGSGVRRFGWATSGGQRVLLDRDGDAVRISNGAGTTIELAERAVRLHAKADLTIEAPGHRLVLRADTVDFERG